MPQRPARRSTSHHVYCIFTGLPTNGRLFCSIMMARTLNGRQRSFRANFRRRYGELSEPSDRWTTPAPLPDARPKTQDGADGASA